MKNPLLKKLLPHIIAIVVFLVVSILFCKPILDGYVLNQHDNIGWKGMAQNAFEYKEKTGHFPLWNPNLFSGMPNYQVAMEGKSVLPNFVAIFSLGLPKPINFFFLACICFYILCLSLRIRPIIGMITSIAYAFSTYNCVILAAGHDTQMLATAFMPLLLAGIINIYEKRYWLGLALTTYGAYQEIGVNHLQVSYYFFLVVSIITIAYLVKWIRDKDFKHIAIAAGLAIVSAIIGLAGNALVLKTTSEYSKFTMRGGKDISIVGDSVSAIKTSGLDTGYAFEYSLGKAESMTLIMPNAFGGHNKNMLSEGSHVAKKLEDKGIAEPNAEQVAQSMPKYWGELYTSGPAYLGVLICLFGVLGFVLVKEPIRWALLAATLLGMAMSWGKFLPGFNTFLFEHLPFYNKFRSPAFAQVIPQFTIGISAALAMQRIFFGAPIQKTDFKKILYTVGGLFALLGIMYLMMDYSYSYDSEISRSISEQAKSEEIGRAVISGLKADRRALFGGQLLRAIGLSLTGLAAIFLYYKQKISALIATIAILVIATLDITLVSKNYLNEEKEHYILKDDYTNANFGKTPIDEQLLKDTDPNFRVFNLVGTSTGGPFSESRTSYYHKSIGGYHPAKLRIYQDVIERYLSGSPNFQVLNMLNTKYIITQDQQSGQPLLMPNPSVYGACWFVKDVVIMPNKVEEFKSIGTTNLRDTALVEKSFAGLVVKPAFDSSSTIRMTRFDNDVIEYEANSNGPQFAVFSEIYYPLGWNAYIDGKKTEYCNVDYILRGMSVPTGKHNIKFVFEPASVKKGTSLMFLGSILILIVFLGGLFMHFWGQYKLKKSSFVS